MRIATTGLHPPFVHSAARAGSPFVPGPQARSCTAMKWFEPQPQGSSLGSGLFCPGPSSLNRPHPPHSQAHRDFAALRFIRDAFAVRECLGDPRVVPSFRCTFLLSMSPSTSPGSRSLHPSSSFTRRACLRRLSYGSALPTLADFGAYGFTFVTTYQVARLPTGDFYSRAFNGLVTLPVVGYDYGGNWTISTGGTFTRRTGS